MNMKFQGFPTEGIEFLKNLKCNNNRDWFQENKKLFKTSLEEPAKAFLAEMSDELVVLTNHPMGGKIFRIYRDVRFGKDKTPYNTHIRMSFMCQDSKKKVCGSQPAFHFSLGPDKVTIGLGNFEFSKDGLLSYQAAVASDKTGKKLEATMTDMILQGFRIESPEYKRVPRGFDPNHPRGDLLRRKGLTVWNDSVLPKELSEHKVVDYCLKQYQSMLPMYQWLDALD